METLLLSIAAISVVWLAVVGGSVLFAELTADDASEFSFAQRLWVGQLTGSLSWQWLLLGCYFCLTASWDGWRS